MKLNIKKALTIIFFGSIAYLYFQDNSSTEYYICNDREYKLDNDTFYYDNKGDWLIADAEITPDRIISNDWVMDKNYSCKEEHNPVACSFKMTFSRVSGERRRIITDRSCTEHCKYVKKVGDVISSDMCLIKRIK